MNNDKTLTTPGGTVEEGVDAAAADTEFRDPERESEYEHDHESNLEHGHDLEHALAPEPERDLEAEHGLEPEPEHTLEPERDLEHDHARDRDRDHDPEPETELEPEFATAPKLEPEPFAQNQDIAVDGSLSDTNEQDAVFERWTNLQILFVEDPSSAVSGADALIDEIVEARRKAFDAHRTSLTDRWRNADAGTEDLRLILKDYRKILGDLFPRQN